MNWRIIFCHRLCVDMSLIAGFLLINIYIQQKQGWPLSKTAADAAVVGLLISRIVSKQRKYVD